MECGGHGSLTVDFLGLVGEQGAGFVGERPDDLETGTDFVFVEDRLERVGGVAVAGDIAVEAGDSLLAVLAGALLLLGVVADDDGAATDAAAGDAAGVALLVLADSKKGIYLEI
ncbi:hypothetical protein GFU70_21605 [Pseudomonas brassicacearum]|nr:hypothetical protein [Pseudomonas brassicacearum]QGA51598.1 hypothetical protein GFU70_21605 [Pseudomonas brassicacearum]